MLSDAGETVRVKTVDGEDRLMLSGYGKIVKKDIQRLLLEQGLIPDAMQ